MTTVAATNGRTVVGPTPVRWHLLLWPPLVISFLLFALPQIFFVWTSFHRNLGFGLISPDLTVANYVEAFTDPFYLSSLWLTFYLSLGAALVVLALGFPTAYLLARTRSRWLSFLIGLLLISSFVTVVIKVLGLEVILSQEGMVNDLLRTAGLIDRPLRMIDNEIGVLIGLVQYTLPLAVMILFSVIQTIPKALEDAAEIHGATHWRVLQRVVLPIAQPGLVATGLMVFNMNMGAFTSAILLGGGHVLTLPVLIQRTIMLDVDYPMGAALATLLLVIVFCINLASALVLVNRPRRRIAR